MVSGPQGDQDLLDVRATLGGDERAFARLVERYQGEIARQMWHFTRDRDRLDELVSDVFVAAYTGLAGFRGDAPFEHWIRRIATRVGYGFWKNEARERDRMEKLEQLCRETPAASYESPSEAAEQLHELLGRMAPDDRLVLMLQYFEECDNGEIAARTGWTRAAVKVRAFRARRRLQAMFEEIGFGRKRDERSAAGSG